MKIKALNLCIQITVKQIVTLAGVLGVGATAIYLYKNLNNIQQKNDKIQLVNQQQFVKNFQQVIKKVELVLKNNNKILNNEVIKQILKNQYKLGEEQLKRLIGKMRLLRRKLMKDKIQYSKIIKDQQKQIQGVMDKNLNAILANFKIDKTQWLDKVDQWISQNQQNQQQWEDILSKLQNKKLDSLRNKTKQAMSIKKLQQILKFKIFTLQHISQSQIDFQSSLLSTDQDPDLNAKYQLINTYINDLVFKKFNSEQQDINYSQNQLNALDKDRFLTISDQFTELIRNQILGPESQQTEQQNPNNYNENQNHHNQQQSDDQAQYY